MFAEQRKKKEEGGQKAKVMKAILHKGELQGVQDSFRQLRIFSFEMNPSLRFPLVKCNFLDSQQKEEEKEGGRKKRLNASNTTKESTVCQKSHFCPKIIFLTKPFWSTQFNFCAKTRGVEDIHYTSILDTELCQL